MPGTTRVLVAAIDRFTTWTGVVVAWSMVPLVVAVAWEVVARYQQQEIDDDAFDQGYANPTTSAKSAKTWGAGLNWYLNQWVKLAVNYEQTRFEQGGGGSLTNPQDREDERVLLSRLQFSF